MDTFVHYGFAAAVDALTDSGLLDEDSTHNPERIGCALGSGIGGLKTIEDTTEAYLEHGPRKVSPFFIPGSIINMIGGFLSIKYKPAGTEHRHRLRLQHGHPQHGFRDAHDPVRRCGRDGCRWCGVCHHADFDQRFHLGPRHVNP